MISLIDYCSEIAIRERDEEMKNVDASDKTSPQFNYALGVHLGLNRALSFLNFLKELLKKVS